MTRLLIGSFVLLVLGVAFVSGYWYMATPSNGTVIQQGSASKNSDRIDTPTSLNGLAFRATVPAGYGYQSRAPIAPEVESYRIIADRNHQQTISVYVTEQTTTRMTEDAAYILRASQPEKYQQGDVTIDGSPATSWTARDGSEQTIFSSKGNKLLVIAVSMYDKDQMHRSAVTEFLNSLRWQ